MDRTYDEPVIAVESRGAAHIDQQRRRRRTKTPIEILGCNWSISSAHAQSPRKNRALRRSWTEPSDGEPAFPRERDYSGPARPAQAVRAGLKTRQTALEESLRQTWARAHRKDTRAAVIDWTGLETRDQQHQHHQRNRTTDCHRVSCSDLLVTQHVSL